MIILFQLKYLIFVIKLKNLLIDKDFFFEFIIYFNIILYIYLINIKSYKILIKNDINYVIKIFKKFKFETFFEFDYENVFFVKLFYLRKSFIIKNIN